MDGLKELEKYLVYIVAVTKSFGGPVNLQELPQVRPSWVSAEEGTAGPIQTKDLSTLSLGNGANHREHHGRRQHLKMEKIIRPRNTSSSQGRDLRFLK